MSIQNFPNNTLYEMDNLLVLRGMNSETVDLIATDPPFNTKRNRASSAGFYVNKWRYGDPSKELPDQWKWNEIHPKWLEEIQDNHKALHSAIKTAEVCQDKDTAAFLCFLSVRLLEMHRILKPTGSIYLHCDRTVSHYIKACMDAIFGKKNFRNEIIWHYTGNSTPKTMFPAKHDTIFLYVKSRNAFFSPILVPYAKSTIRRYNHIDEDGRRYKISALKDGKQEKVYMKEGKMADSVWDIPIVRKKKEKTGAPDQKPLKLYGRMIEASSNEGDIVLDPFCGCATTIIAANNLKRRWIGIDRRPDARYQIITRFMGITKQEREDLEKKAQHNNQAWLDKQTASYEMHYQTEPPIRTDNGNQTIAELPQVYSAEPENYHSRDEMKEILIDKFDVECWGCGFQPPDSDERYLHLDHINPKSSGGSNNIDNRSILCQPCNSAKSNTMTLDGLRKQNKKEQRLKKSQSQLIDISLAVRWSRDFLNKLIRDRTYQRELNLDT